MRRKRGVGSRPRPRSSEKLRDPAYANGDMLQLVPRRRAGENGPPLRRPASLRAPGAGYVRFGHDGR